MLKRTLYHLFLFVFFLGTANGLTAQEEAKQVVGNNQLETWFTKPSLVQKTSELSFNVINLTNKSSDPLSIKPRLSTPDGFAIFSTAFVDTIIPPNTTIRLPYRLRISGEAAGNIEHKIVFRVFSDNNQLLIENTSIVQPEAFHDWKIDLPKDRVFFYPRFNLAEFDIVITNDGNVGEMVNLDIQPDQKLSFSDEMADDWKAAQTVYVPAKTDTTISFKVNYTYSKERIFDLSKVNILASTQDKEIRRAAFVEKYNDEYSPLIVDNTLPHHTEVGVRTRTLSTTNGLEPFVYARGVADFKNKSSFKYLFANYRINETDNFIRNTNYRFLYEWKGLSVGLGTFGSQLGRNLYSRNALMVDYKTDIGPEHKIEGYASQDLIDPKTSAAAGHWWDNGKYNLHSAASYNMNGVNNINTTTLLFSTKELPIYKEHSISAVLYGLREDYLFTNPYYQQGYAWDLVYNGNIGTRFKAKIFNNYGSPNIPGNQMGMFNIGGLLTFFPNDLMTYFTATYHYYTRNYYYRDFYGQQLPDIYLQDQYVNFIYHNHRNEDFTWSLGPSAEDYYALRPELANYNYSSYKIDKFSLEFKSFAFKSFRVEMETGMRKINYTGNTVIDTLVADFHLNANYSFKGYGVRLKYDYGPLVNTGLYQRAADMSYNGVNIGPYLVKGYAHNRVVAQIYTNFMHRFDLHYSYFNISPRIDIYLTHDWYAKIGGNYTYYRQNTPEYYAENDNYFVEFSIAKKWGNTEYYRKQRQLRRIKIVCFKDENGNGRKDKYEDGIPYIKTRLKLVRQEIQPAHESFPIDIALLTNDEGFVIFNQIPKGFYKVEIIPLIDMREYFYVSSTHEEIDLIENTTYYIPFQKASKIEGALKIQKAKFSQENPLDLSRIKITAYNQAGNSYSSFTRTDGKFTIYVPGDTTYYLRMENVFGSKYRIVQNDISRKIPEETDQPVIFNIVEKGKQIKFKSAKKPVTSGPTKTKILKGKIYENTDRKPIDVNALPFFDMGDGSAYERSISSGKYYLVIEQNVSREDALKSIGILQENNVEAYFGFDENTMTYYVFSNDYSKKNDAEKGIKELKSKGVKNASIMVFK